MENVETLALGQRTGEMILNSAWQDGEVQLVTDNGLVIEDLVQFWVRTGGQETLNASIPTVKHEREVGNAPSRPVQTQYEADMEVHEDVRHNDMSGAPSNVSELVPDLSSDTPTQE